MTKTEPKAAGRGLTRVVAGVVGVVLGVDVVLVLLNQIRTGFELFGVIPGVAEVIIIVYCVGVALAIPPKKFIRWKASLRVGLVCGLLGFIGGFFGPLIFTPKANLGPLLGIFITGPLGFVAGTLCAWLYDCITFCRRSSETKKPLG